MHKVPVAVHAIFLITGPGKDNGPVRKHGPAFIRDVQEIAVAFLTLFVLKGGISNLAVTLMIIRVLSKMQNNVFNAMHRLCVEKVVSVMGCRKVAIHTVRYKALGIVDVG